MVDTLGLVWGLSVTPVSVTDCKGARAAVEEAQAVSGGKLTRLWADAACRVLLALAWVLLDVTVEVVKRRVDAGGFEVQPQRLVAERTFGWLAW